MVIGDLFRTHREAQRLSTYALTNAMGGTPTATFIGKIERGEVVPTPRTAEKMCEALGLPKDVVLNACGYATPVQQAHALVEWKDASLTKPVAMQVPVLDPDAPDADPQKRGTRLQMLKRPEDVFLIDLEGPANEPFTGEILVSRERQPKSGQGVIAEVDGRLGAWKWSDTGITNGTGERRADRWRLFGVILRRNVTEDLA